MSQELLVTFGDQIGEVAIAPAPSSVEGGQFNVWLDDDLVYNRTAQGRFPELKELKQILRDRINPSLGLGHSDSDVGKK